MDRDATTKDPAPGAAADEYGPLSGSLSAYERAGRVMPGGTTRTTVERLPFPLYVESGQGAWLTDVDGNRYLDLNNNHTTLIHGHAFQPVIKALEQQLRRGTCFANPTEAEIALAEIICARLSVAERIRFVNTGTEAVMFAIKAARAITGRVKIAKFEGAYHGAYDWAEISQSSGPDVWGDPYPNSVPPATGIPPSVVDEVIVLPFNDTAATVDILDRHGPELACVIIDLAASRLGLIPAEAAFLEPLRSVTRRHGILVIDDEVLNFRQGYRGAAGLFDFEPDLVTLGKIIGGGMPIGAIAGSAKLMSVFDSSSGTAVLPQGGTFSANPLSMVAGAASMRALDPPAFERLNELGCRARAALRRVIDSWNAPLSVTGLGSLFRVHPKTKSPRSYRDAYQSPNEAALMKRIAAGMLRRGVVMPPATSSSLSTPMTDEDIDHLVAAFDATVQEELT